MIFYMFAFLQLLDALTTAIFLKLGIEEGNPLVLWALKDGATNHHSSLVILLYFKAIFVVLCGAFWAEKRLRPKTQRIFHLCNIAFAGVVIWNLIAIMRVLSII